MSSIPSSYGANIAFIEELYEKYRASPDAVSASWREFFHDYKPQAEEEVEESVAAAPTPAPHIAAVPAEQPNAVPLRGAAGKIAQNMEASLAVPTATSIRNIPVKALEENRRVINHHLALIGQPKASYTHIIG